MLSEQFLVEIPLPTTETEEKDYDILIQGSDRKYPAIVIRRKHRGKGAVVRTISKNGQHSDLYADYESTIQAYLKRREDRRQNTISSNGIQDNSPNSKEIEIDKILQSVVEGRARQDNV